MNSNVPNEKVWKMKCAMKGHVTRFFTNLGRNEKWKNPRTNVWSRNFNLLNTYS
jgi:hypothetical protein